MNEDFDEDREIEDLPAKDEAGASQEAELPAGTDSSTVADVSKTEDASSEVPDIVRDVLDKRKTDSAASSASPEATDQTETTTPTRREPDNENYSDAPFHKHPRFQHVLRERNTYREGAQRYENVERFLRDNGLVADEAAELLQIGALIKTNPVAAWERMRPTVEKLLVAAGQVLPPELQDAVNTGQIAREHALRISQTDARLNAIQAEQTFRQQQAARQAEDDRQRGVIDAVNAWESDRTLKDPWFADKLPEIQAEVRLLQQGGWRPNDAAGAKMQLDRAYATVNGRQRPNAQRAQQKPAVRMINGGNAAGNVPAERPEGMDLVNQVLARRRRA